jgi:hypothetical protein
MRCGCFLEGTLFLFPKCWRTLNKERKGRKEGENEGGGRKEEEEGRKEAKRR